MPTEPNSPNEVWNWNSLSKIVEQINQSKTWNAVLKITDRPAVFLCQQTNAGVPMPYECVVSDVGLIGLLEPSLPIVAATPSGSLVYQPCKYVQVVTECDRRSFTLGVSRRRQETLTRGREPRADGSRIAPERSLVCDPVRRSTAAGVAEQSSGSRVRGVRFRAALPTARG